MQHIWRHCDLDSRLPSRRSSRQKQTRRSLPWTWSARQNSRLSAPILVLLTETRVERKGRQGCVGSKKAGDTTHCWRSLVPESTDIRESSYKMCGVPSHGSTHLLDRKVSDFPGWHQSLTLLFGWQQKNLLYLLYSGSGSGSSKISSSHCSSKATGEISRYIKRGKVSVCTSVMVDVASSVANDVTTRTTS